MKSQTFTTRPLSLDDIQQFIEMSNALAIDMRTHRLTQSDMVLVEWKQPNFDLTRSSHGIFTDDDRLVGYVIVWDVHDRPVHPWMEWGLLPDFQDHHLSTQLLDWADKKGQSLIDRCPPDARVSLHTNVLDGYTFMEAAIQYANYTPIRSSFDMRLDMDSEPLVVNAPEGFVIRRFTEMSDLEGLVRAFQDSFSDHYNHIKRPFDQLLDEFRHWFGTDSVDPEFVLLAIENKSNDIAGYILPMREAQDPPVGYIDLVGVRPAYRRRGLAQTLLLNSFRNYWNRGTKCVTLEVDGESTTNTVALYERVGMFIEFQYTRYEKVIRGVQDLSMNEL